MVCPAGILNAPIFDPNADPAIDYGARRRRSSDMRSRHGFDDQGQTIDATGALRDSWTPADAADV